MYRMYRIGVIIMAKFTNFIKKILPSRRKIIQLYTALLFNANFKGFVSGNISKASTKTMCVPGLNCYSCPGAVGACPLGSLQGSFSAGKSTVFYVFGILVLFGILFGRMICGFFCPFGLIQELLHKIKTPKLKKGPVTRILSVLKYVILVFFVFLVPILYAFKDTPLPAFCKYICPAGTLEGGLGLLSNEVNASYFSMLGPLFTWKFLLLVSFVVGSIFVFRLFCRFICPLGALYSFFNRISLFGVKLEQSKCTQCGLCVSHCKMDIKHVGDRECISCGECMSVCPTNAIQWKGPKILLRPNETDTAATSQEMKKKKNSRLILRCIAWGLALVVLIGAIVYYWNEDSGEIPVNPTPGTSDSPMEQGNEVGKLCYGYDLEIMDSTGVTSQTIDPTKAGKITIINFWGTWCTPCVNELPYFDQIAAEYADTVKVIAIHTNMVYETAPAFLEKYYADSSIIFAKDYALGTTEGYYSTLGGRGTYPYTVILNEDGVIVSIFVSSLTYEDLKTVVEEQLKS